MIDKFDYLEPCCPLSGGKDFYEFDPAKPQGHIPVQNVIRKLDACLNKECYDDAKRVLEYWRAEARALNDRSGELSVLNEMLGLSRKINDEAMGLEAANASLALLATMDETVSKGTILLNTATTLKAFGEPRKAIAIYEHAQSIYEKLLPKGDERFAGLYNNKAITLTELAEYDEAERLYLQSIELLRHEIDSYPDVAITYTNLADLYEMRDGADCEKIEEAIELAYKYLFDPKVKQDGYLAFVCRKCAPVFGYYGYFLWKTECDEKADRLYERN